MKISKIDWADVHREHQMDIVAGITGTAKAKVQNMPAVRFKVEGLDNYNFFMHSAIGFMQSYSVSELSTGMGVYHGSFEDDHDKVKKDAANTIKQAFASGKLDAALKKAQEMLKKKKIEYPVNEII